MRFQLIDRIERLERGRSLRARKLTSLSETFWQRGQNGPRMPGYLILEALCQAGSWLVLLSTDGQRRATLLTVGRVEFLDPVLPGDVLTLDVEAASLTSDAALMSGEARVGDRLVARVADVMCALMDAEELEDPEQTDLMGRVLLGALGEPR
ncbi:beta-hydroxyacyl-ACP dehydratase [Solihabitans fulvus]|uniref:Beta-hydroxyacyl-ACP dehydratase n=1 Tax=Solihabitans fulvus TaxID=1892852 RepID=A0A5B2XI01_9PSEU|nr:3-hydroxyacyl-ACP dehydratase FabZ family protein [Solihabitans fulvus]KAA2262695.1 beta-hydroxyacyl-ACP dehydratase [Solihabitans fulvus]